jgi:hypothetical protein
MSVPPIHARTVRTNGGSCFSGILHLGASQLATMPTSDRFFVAFRHKTPEPPETHKARNLVHRSAA